MQKNSASLTCLSRWTREPHKLGHLLGFKKLTPEHDKWVHLFLNVEYGRVRILQAHRGAYKTTCGLVAMTLLVMHSSDVRILIARKSQKMASKLIGALQKVFASPVVQMWMKSRWGIDTLETDKWNTTELRLSINKRISPEPNFTAVGTATAQTGDHYDFIWSDDIITPEDRYSEKERDRTKNYIHELENIIDPTGIRVFSGTPWHEKDGFTMLEMMGYHIHRYPIGSIPIAELTPEIIEQKKKTTPRSLWSANMLLKHERDTNPEFGEPIFEDCPKLNMPLYAFIDGAFGGENNVAIWIAGEHRGLIYLVDAVMYGNSIADHWADIDSLYHTRNIRKFYYEDNGAQKLIGSRLDEMKIPNGGVTSSTNKYADITNTLKPLWSRLRFATHLKPVSDVMEEVTEDTIPHPLTQVLEFNEQTEKDDSPDALAKLCKKISGMSDDFIGDFPKVEKFSTEFIVAFVSTTVTDASMPDRTSVTILAMVPNPGIEQKFLAIEFTGRSWDKAMVHPTVIKELVEFLDIYQPIEVCLQTQQDDDNVEIFIQRLQQAEEELGVKEPNLWERVIQGKGRHERIMMHVAGNKDRLSAIEGTDKDYLNSIIFYTKDGKQDVESDSLASAVHRWQTSENLQNYIYGADQLARLRALDVQ